MNRHIRVTSWKRVLGLLGSLVCVTIIITSLAIVIPRLINKPMNSNWTEGLIEGTAATHLITDEVQTSFSTYIPQSLEYTPQIVPTRIKANLANVDLQGLSLPADVVAKLEEYGFALVDEGYEDIYDIYDVYSVEEILTKSMFSPKFVTTDLCLHSFHVLYDISLRLLEGQFFFQDFEAMLRALRDEQFALNSTVSSEVIQSALSKNIAYLSVMLYLLNSTTNPIPAAVNELTIAELENINTSDVVVSPIFGYKEDYSQYTIRGHYSRNALLSNYFKAMMYAGRMGFLLQSPEGDPAMGFEHTRMALLLISSFDAAIGAETVWDYWDRIYQPTVFYVGASDDLTAVEYYQIWQNNSAPEGDALADDNLIAAIVAEAKSYRNPKINSMIIYPNYENLTQGFRLMGQRYIPDSYIFQQLVFSQVGTRLLPIGLDVFSVFGSPRAAQHLQPENETHPDYSSQIVMLREQFGNLTDYEWSQNLYWSWLYTLFPLLAPATEGFPGFMLSDAWTDKALMTVMASWAELRHDTILYAKQSYTELGAIPTTPEGYVEPYPEVYSRLASLVRFLKDGLTARGLVIEGFSEKLDALAEIFDRLVEISIKELENEPLTQDDLSFIDHAGYEISQIASYHDPSLDPWVSEADQRMAIIADVHTDPNSGKVLEVATGDPYVIYVIVQDQNGKLRLARGGTFSYYEFTQPMTDRLSDEQWHELLDTNPPDLPAWISGSIPIIAQGTFIAATLRKRG